ncbi:actin-related protein Arp6 [Pisolithus marmoratus]|nr:actin-related protein Arp6 [Pisolithus marmoratus]
MAASQTVVLDNGGSTIKAGILCTDLGDDDEVSLIPNAVVRSKGDKATFVGHEIGRCKDYSTLHYRLPFEKGYLVDWDAQKAIWDGLFSSEVLSVNTSESSLLITEPYFNLPNIQEIYDQFVFEEYEFLSYHRCTPAAMIPYGQLFAVEGLQMPECSLIVDSGFSFTHVIPIINHQIQWHAVKRLDVGGKLLTNQLKEVISYRQWNMMDETYIVNHVKETCCYVSANFFADLETCRLKPKKSGIALEYILPNYVINTGGAVREPGHELAPTDQVLVMENERFTIPELLFRPDDIGLEQSGLPSMIAASISLLPEDLQGMFWANIGLIGGNTKFPGFYERLMSELRSLSPVEYDIQIYRSKDAITEAYRSSLGFVRSADFTTHLVTRAEYLESGTHAIRRKFGHWQSGNSGKSGERVMASSSSTSTVPQLSKKPSRSRLRTTASTSSRRR